jgi:hypothetical protein
VSPRQIWILNGALSVLLIWGTMNVVDGWKAFEAGHQPRQLETKPDAAGGKTVAAAEVAAAPTINEAWPEIASRDPFSFDRSDVNLVEVKAPPVALPKPTLFGTLVLGDVKVALMGKAGASTRTGPPVKVGETFEGWKVINIDNKSVVVMADGVEESLVVGRVPIVRNTEKTTASAPPSVSVVAPPPVPTPANPAPAPRANQAAINSWRPGMPAPPGTHIVSNPFGQTLQQDGP